MLTEITAALGSIKATSDIIKGLNASFTEAKLNEVKLDLQRALIDATQALANAQSNEAAAALRVSNLEQEIVKLKDWSTEKQRYQFHDVGGGAFAYVPKLGMEYGEPAHWLCANCFNHGSKSFMQCKGNGVGNKSAADRGLDKTFACDKCKSSFQVGWRKNPARDLVDRIARAEMEEIARDHMD